MNRKEENYINRILKKDVRALEEIYDTYSASFVAYFKQYGLSTPELEDAFQDSIIAFYQNVIQGRLKNLDVSIKNYIWAIGKHKVIDILRKNKTQNFDMPIDNIEPYEMVETQLNEQQILLYTHFKSLGDSCQKILKYFYYEGLTIQEIVEIGEYKDENTVKSSKSRCIKLLRNLIKSA